MSKLCKKTGFIYKLQAILENQQLADIITWSSCGNSFLILDVAIFESVVLGSYFRHKRMSSFIRQLNMYGFHKQRSDKEPLQFHHPLFKKDNSQAFYLIERKKASQVTFKENLIEQYSKEQLSKTYLSDKCMPSIKDIEAQSQPNMQLSFRLNGSRMTIRLTEGLTSLGKVEIDEQLALENQGQIMPQKGYLSEQWRDTIDNYQYMLVPLEEEEKKVSFI